MKYALKFIIYVFALFTLLGISVIIIGMSNNYKKQKCIVMGGQPIINMNNGDITNCIIK